MKLLIVIVILLLFCTNAYALSWSDATVSPSSGVEYSPTAGPIFQISWDAGAYSISEVKLELTKNGNRQNYTAQETSPNVYILNLTDSPLNAGSYTYRWYAVDDGPTSNFTGNFPYVVSKNATSVVHLYLNGVRANRSYDLNTFANLTASLALPEDIMPIDYRTVYLNSTFPGFLEKSGTFSAESVINVSWAGIFAVTAYWNDINSEGYPNYVKNSETFYFDTILSNPSGISETPSGSATYTPEQNYFFNITWTDETIKEVRFESNYSGNKKNYTVTSNPKVYNESGNFWFNVTGIIPKDFVYRWLAKDVFNRWSGTDQKIYRVFKAYALILYPSLNQEVINGSTSVMNCYSLTEQITVKNFKFYRNSTLIDNSSDLARSDVSVLPVGFYKYECHTDGNENYTNQTLKANLTVLSKEGEKKPEVMEFKITSVSSPTILAGESGKGYFNLSSTLNETLTNIKVELTGIDSGLYTIENIPSALLKGGSSLIRIDFDVPEDYDSGSHNITIKVTAKATSGTKTATSYMKLNVNYATPQQNRPPSYSGVESQMEGSEVYISFTLYDDSGVSGYILSFNDTGEWVNESWTPSDTGDININKTIEAGAGSVAWKVFLNDTDNVWSASEEYVLSKRETETDYTVPIIIVVVSVAVAVALYILQKMKPQTTRKNVVYVYAKDDV